jgi:hypothetical protein
MSQFSSPYSVLTTNIGNPLTDEVESGGFLGWFSRYVLAWRLSNTLDGSFCLEMLEEALRRGQTFPDFLEAGHKQGISETEIVAEWRACEQAVVWAAQRGE